MNNADFGLSTRSLTEISDLLAKAFADLTPVSVFVFGSRARGDFRPASDLDLMVESKHPLIRQRMSTLRENLENSSLPIKVDLVHNDDVFEDYREQIEGEKKLLFEAS